MKNRFCKQCEKGFPTVISKLTFFPTAEIIEGWDSRFSHAADLKIFSCENIPKNIETPILHVLSIRVFAHVVYVMLGKQ